MIFSKNFQTAKCCNGLAVSFPVTIATNPTQDLKENPLNRHISITSEQVELSENQEEDQEVEEKFTEDEEIF